MIEIASATGTQELWKQERIVAHINTAYDLLFWTDLEGSSASPIATYTPDSAGDVYIDLSDYIRTYPSVATLYFLSDETTYTIAVSVIGLINPDNVLIPAHPFGSLAAIAPPTMIIGTTDQNVTLVAELYAPNASTIAVTGSALLGVDHRVVGQIDGAFALTIDGTTKHYIPRPMVCDKLYAYVNWVSFTGESREHVWEVIKQSTAAADNYELLTIENDYNEIKGRVDSLVLRLEGLSQYDLWYYADILTSSDVQLSFDGETYTRVQITTKNYTLPDGNADNGKLEIQVNYRRYDAVAM